MRIKEKIEGVEQTLLPQSLNPNEGIYHKGQLDALLELQKEIENNE